MTGEWLHLRFVRDVALLERARTREAPTLVFPLERSVVGVHALERDLVVDRSSFALVPARVPYALSAASSVAPTVCLGVGASAIESAEREYAPHFERATFDAIASELQLLPRTRWMDEIVQRYLFERDVCQRDASAAARFLETEITKELFFLGKERREEHTRASVVHEDDQVVERARTYLEARLFEPISIANLARHCKTSESTLLRAFRRALGAPPAAWVRNRRLEESLHLLESGRYGVGEVATRVGYASLAAFTVAFRRRFGAAPSSVRPRGAPVLPPHGKEPKRRRRDTS